MSVKHAVLALLAERPSYQYQLADQMEQRMGPGWAVNSGQVSTDVRALVSAELIRIVSGADDPSGNRTIYELTDQGSAELERFFSADTPPVRLSRRSIQVQITFAGKERLPDLLTKLDARERQCMARLGELMETHQESAPPAGALLRADNVLLRVNLSADLNHLEAELSWVRHAREMISWLITKEKAIWPSASNARRDASSRERQRPRLVPPDRDEGEEN
ncbi:MAG TPA: PadR family transcriptional regulator [Solirubrobacteraceae bacterium]|jgi:DNA-binding PadR family transcriptional regulator|nr:PadR family transcriptional regulator [Solirubrobacteraceae bacterium]